MIPELGHFALVLALCLALVQGTVPMFGAAWGIPGWMALARPAAWAQSLFILMAFVCLVTAFIQNDFSVSYVAQNSNSALPVMYRISAVWGAHEGSLLLWATILAVWMSAVALFSRSLPDETIARVLGVMGLVSVGFLLFMLLTSNPFERLMPAAMDGRDLNPLLQDPGLVVHPPMLYTGYVGFSVAFAFAIAALLGGRLDSAWARWSRPWTIVAWSFLTVGIALGSWWSYYELGWGGWWFWDPVENASFMPWLVGTALIHSLAVTEKRGAFRSWTVLLAVFAFSLSLLGTFLVRSGVLTSVHAFANDPKRGVFILAFLGAVVGSSLVLYAWRAPKVVGSGNFQLYSRESLLLVNNVLLVVAMASILTGTIYPLALDALNLGKISAGPPYFNIVFVPIMVPLVLLIGIGPATRWKQDSPWQVLRRLRFAVLVSILAGFAYPLLMGSYSLAVGAAMAIALWIWLTTLMDMRAKAAHKTSLWAGLRALPRSYYGMVLAHTGVGIFIVGVTLVTAYGVEEDVRMAVGDSHEVGGYSFRFDGVKEGEGPNYTASTGTLHVSKNGKEVTVLRPEKRVYWVQRMPMTEAAIHPGLLRDLYAALGERLPDGAWSVRIYYKPFVRWIWLGALFMAFGGVLAASDRRYRVMAKRASARAPAITGGGATSAPAR